VVHPLNKQNIKLTAPQANHKADSSTNLTAKVFAIVVLAVKTG
jgi:hypothetical protein